MRRRLVVVLGFVCAGLLPQACDTPSRDRKQVLARLREAYGQDAIIRVAYSRDSSNLLVHLDAPAFSGMSDSLFDSTARVMARLALQYYTRATQLDSITIAAIESPLARLRRNRHFAIPELR